MSSSSTGIDIVSSTAIDIVSSSTGILLSTGVAVANSTDSGIQGWMPASPGNNIIASFLGGIACLVLAVIYAYQIMGIKVDTDKFPETSYLAGLIASGAEAFLRAEYSILAVFEVIIFIVLSAGIAWETGVCFILGAALSAAAGYFGMRIATRANIRTTLACNGPDGLNNGLNVAFKSGSVMAMTVCGFGLVGLSVLYTVFNAEAPAKAWEHLSGFAFGASSVALFARVGGGIYTKAADVGADLVGKVEEDLDEDDADNPATIADNVGDNVGDVAGMGADLFESYVGSLVAAATIGRIEYGEMGIGLPFWISGLGAVASLLGTFMVRAKPQEGNKTSGEILESLLGSLRVAIYGASVLSIIGCGLAVMICFGGGHAKAWELWGCCVVGLLCGNAIGYATEYSTSYTYYPTKSIAQKSDTGPATVIIQGLGVGMLSTVPPVVFVVISILIAFYLADMYGIAISAVGMLSTLGVTLATDAYGPVADNAGGIAEMSPESEISRDVRERTDALDALGNTTAATGKGLAIGSAVLTALALMAAFADAAKMTTDVNLLDPVVLPGILLGAMLPFVFAALTMLSVGKAAESIMWECRDQLNRRWESGAALDPAKCIRISTVSSIREMMAPGTLAVFSPVVVGFVLGSRGLLGLLAGSISSGFLLAVTMANAGGAWDNAKKYVEKGNLGPEKGKKSLNHKAVVVGDTVGDPFKDTSGPALNILIKLMSIVSLVMAPAFGAKAWDNWWVGLIMIIVYIFGGFLYNMHAGNAQLHDKKAIEEVSQRRKADPREKKNREEREAKKSAGPKPAEEKKAAPSGDEPDPFEAQGSAKGGSLD